MTDQNHHHIRANAKPVRANSRPAQLNTAIESFEDYTDATDLAAVYRNGHTNYNTTDKWEVSTLANTHGSQSLSVDSAAGWHLIYNMPSDGDLSHYLAPGDTWEWYCHVPQGRYTSAFPRQTWGHTGDLYEYYKTQVDYDNDEFEFYMIEYVDGSYRTNLVDKWTDIGLTDDWIRVETYWADGSKSGEYWGEYEFDVEIVDSFDADGWASTTTSLLSASSYETTYGAGGQGWSFTGASDAQYFDGLRLLNG